MRVVHCDRGWVWGVAGAVLNGVADRRWVAFEGGFRREGDLTGGRIDRPRAFARDHEGFAVGAADDLYRRWVDVVVGIGVVAQDVDRYRRAGGCWSRGVIGGNRCSGWRRDRLGFRRVGRAIIIATK